MSNWSWKQVDDQYAQNDKQDPDAARPIHGLAPYDNARNNRQHNSNARP